jgi:LacI family transcriptional regulator
VSSNRPTLKDVARLAGVHPATASRALSGTRGVSPEHLRAVQNAARRLDYHVNPIGRALKQRATGTVGMLVPDIENPFFPALVRGVERALDREGLGLVLCDADNSVPVEAQRLDALVHRQVDSLIISSVHAERSLPAIRRAAARVPAVQVDRIADVPTDTVEVDQRYAIEALVAHVRAAGARRLVFVTSGNPISPVRRRLAAFRALPGAMPVIEVDTLTVEAGRAAGTRLVAAGEPYPDAVICVNDPIAIGVLDTLRRAGIEVPGRVAVTGVDDTAYSTIAEPSLTTIHQPVKQMGDEVVRMIVTRRAAPDLAPRRMVLTPHLVVRDSAPGPRRYTVDIQ